MKFADFICRDAIRADLEAADKEGAIREMVQALTGAKRVDADEFESIVKAILKREDSAAPESAGASPCPIPSTPASIA